MCQNLWHTVQVSANQFFDTNLISYGHTFCRHILWDARFCGHQPKTFYAKTNGGTLFFYYFSRFENDDEYV